MLLLMNASNETVQYHKKTFLNIALNFETIRTSLVLSTIFIIWWQEH